MTKIITNSTGPGCAVDMRNRADGGLAVWAAPEGRQIQSFLLDGLQASSIADSLRAADGGAASSHRWPRGPFLIRLAGPASPAEFLYSLLCVTKEALQKLDSKLKPAKTRAAGEAGLRA
ncbi:hypothetical protein [Paraburkholderia fungorum]|uniref:hypothetical protein n=1 Tax=Paraburkholderia fungorum TaxID=134537 RepID=UPI00115FCB27|nr:hypothetical protein [Paraburkholderia fungorum]